MLQEPTNSSIQRVLTAIETHAGAGAAYHAIEQTGVQTNDAVCRFCRFCLEHPATAARCRDACCDATQRSLSSGEPFFYRCWAGLLFVTVAIAPGGAGRGGVALGGFFSESEGRDVAQQAVLQRLGVLPDAEVLALRRRLHSLRPISPGDLRGLGSFVLETTLSSGLNSSTAFERQHRRYLQQRRIAEAFETVREQTPSPTEILSDTYELFAYLARQDRDGALRFTSAHLARLLLVSNWDPVKFKAHLRVMIAVITSRSMLDGCSWQEATGRELRYMARIEQAHSTEDSCYEVAEVIMELFQTPPYSEARGGSISERTVSWLQAHYAEPVALSAAGRALGVSVSSLTHRLKSECGQTFGQLLAGVRMAAAKRLLATTDLELSEIAALCGFFDQSHFTRTMKRATSLTPGRFRSMLTVSKALVHPDASK